MKFTPGTFINFFRRAAAALLLGAILLGAGVPARAQSFFFYFREAVKDGKIYVFSSSEQYNKFKSTGDIGAAPINLAGYGPKGEQVFFENENAMDLYNFKHDKDPVDRPTPKPVVMTKAEVPAAAPTPAPAATTGFSPTIKFGGLVQVWGTQMLSNNLRNNSTSVTPRKYYDLSGNFTENTFIVRRAEIKIFGEILKGVTWEILLDPSINTSATNPTILQDVDIQYKLPNGFAIKAGQFKNQQTFEGLTSSADLMFAERSQLSRKFGDKRDRGATVSWEFGDPKEFWGKLTGGVFNGMTDAITGKGNDVNSAKDVVGRLEFTAAKFHKFGIYGLRGTTDLKDSSSAAFFPGTFVGVGTPTAAQTLDNRDETTNFGGFYAFRNDHWRIEAEGITGKLGRRFPAMRATAGAAGREYLDQKFLGYTMAAGYTFNAHAFAVRYDRLDFNSGNNWYTTYNPYTQTTTGLPTGLDFTPAFTEISAGYTYALKWEKFNAANIKFQYIHRSMNFLMPRLYQNGEQGGDSAILALQVAY